MNIPDGAVYAFATPICAAAIWAATKFVDGRGTKPENVTVSDAKKMAGNIAPYLTELLADKVIVKLNGRYMLKGELDYRFDRVMAGLKHNRHELKTVVGKPLIVLLEEKHPEMAEQLEHDLRNTSIPE